MTTDPCGRRASRVASSVSCAPWRGPRVGVRALCLWVWLCAGVSAPPAACRPAGRARSSIRDTTLVSDSPGTRSTSDCGLLCDATHTHCDRRTNDERLQFVRESRTGTRSAAARRPLPRARRAPRAHGADRRTPESRHRRHRGARAEAAAEPQAQPMPASPLPAARAPIPALQYILPCDHLVLGSSQHDRALRSQQRARSL